MAEFPDLGKHCNASCCSRLDFLPIRCDACSLTFCIEHFTYAAHDCANSHLKNVQVPVCPLCNKPVPTPKGVPYDVQVDNHIKNNCTNQQKPKLYSNRCSMKGCKNKELVPFICPSCNLNFCVKHRIDIDHKCEAGKTGNANQKQLSKTALAAMQRNQGQQNCAQQARNTMSEDEALARALELSLNGPSSSRSAPMTDEELAEQLQREENLKATRTDFR
ncbi:hypothetical protein WR25_05416 [Diploscapter pachys]|uniref:AN1-type domain-containing protein n=1 Tax=Diploscapter pachys TaxID=2018661 RepID=A0A2A2KA42_9BILA|nr:hypothetical protein WR25_05416 [Diploscapter pachys]